MLSALSPGLFRQRTKYMGNKYGANVDHNVNEYLTTKTCSNCGRINEIGGSKIHECACGMIVDRDVNSGKDILKVGYTSAENAAEHVNDLEDWVPIHNEDIEIVYNKRIKKFILTEDWVPRHNKKRNKSKVIEV